MYCKYCGKQIDDDSKFCKYCGERFSFLRIILPSKKQIYSDEFKHKIAQEFYRFLKVALVGFIIGILFAIKRRLEPCYDYDEMIGIPFIIMLWVLGIWYIIRFVWYIVPYLWNFVIWIKKWK